MGWRDLAFKLEGQLHKRLLRWGVPTMEQKPVETEMYRDAIKEFVATHGAEAEYVNLDGKYSAPVEVPQSVGTLTDLLLYRPGRFDCEDYALTYKTLIAMLMGINTVGVVIDWSGAHAYNIVMTADGTVSLYEPQEGCVVEVGAEERHEFQNVTILL
jgi:hypothetical protein